MLKHVRYIVLRHLRYSDLHQSCNNLRYNRLLESGLFSQSELPARVLRFRGIPFLRFLCDLELDVPSVSPKRILVNLELRLYSKFKCEGAQIASAMISPVS